MLFTCRIACCVALVIIVSLFPVAALANSAITYMTRMDSIVWDFSGSKFSCRLSHNINDFGVAMFEREAGEQTHFELQSKSPRMKSGEALLISQPPLWLVADAPLMLAKVGVDHGEVPVNLGRKASERMLAELQKGMDLHFVREPWYEDSQPIKVVVPSLGFRQTHSDYLQCLAGLLPVNYSQVQKKSLYYDNGDEGLTRSAKAYLDKVASYVKEDPSVRVLYIDGHTDSEGVRSENLLKSKGRAERVMSYLLERGVNEDMVVIRWHGERYPVASNQTSKGASDNRRVTLRLSKQGPKLAKSEEKLPDMKDDEAASVGKEEKRGMSLTGVKQ